MRPEPDQDTHESRKVDWDSFTGSVAREGGKLFDLGSPIYAARAPGRLDVMGGVADYSGSLVLEGTLGVATYAAIQKRDDRQIVARSLSAERAGWHGRVEMPLEALVGPTGLCNFESVSATLTASADDKWFAYCAGCLYVLLASGWLEPEKVAGVTFFIDSSVPLGAGVSSSASLEVACMEALCGLFGIQMDGLELARLCQIVENRVVGAPCGIMDQVTCALGRPGSLLRLLCRPHELKGYTGIPPGWSFVGIDSAVKHSVGGGYYRRARTAAFMGLAVVERLQGRSLGGYLCELTPAEWAEIRDRVPKMLSGSEFTRQYGDVPDPLSTMDPDDIYPLRASVEHPILEHARVQEFDTILNKAVRDDTDELIEAAGRLMLESHRSYSERLGLGSPETDLLVLLAMEVGSNGGIYGAKITGGGSGGTVALLGRSDRIDTAACTIAGRYRAQSGNEPAILTGSSEGAIEGGVRRLP